MEPTIKERIAEEVARIFPEVTIYIENQRSGFQTPSFFIAKGPTAVHPEFFEGQRRELTYQLIYFASPDKANADMDRVEGLLSDNFLQLKDYATVRNREFIPDSTQQTLIMNFDVILWMRKVEDIPTQERMKFDGATIKED